MNQGLVNILFLTHYSGMGGASIALLTLINELSEFGVKAYVLLPGKGSIEEKLREKKISYGYVPFRAGVISNEYIHSWKFPLKQIKNTIWQVYLAIIIKRYIKKWKIDIIHANSAYVLCGALAGKLTNTKTVWHLRENIGGHFEARFFPERFFVNWTFRNTDRIISVSEYIKEYYSKYDKQNKIMTVYDGTKVYSHKQDYRLHDPVRILYTGGLVVGKGVVDIKLLYEALLNKKIENFQIWMIGVTEKEIKEFILNQDWDTAIIDKLKPMNSCTREELDELRVNMDFFFMPSAYEALGLVTTEAMLIGLPVVGVNSGANKELLGENERGYVYIPGDLEGLGNQIYMCLTQESERLNRIKKAKSWAEESVNSKRCSEKIYLIYRELLQ